MIREVAILTMSSKNGGYCVAGIDTENGKWIRLVSDNKDTHGALSKEDVRYSDGRCCKPLDVVRVAVDKYTPIEHQPENALIDSAKYWEKIRTTCIKDVLKIHPVEYHDVLLGNQYAYITEDGIHKVLNSLILVEVTNFTIFTSVSPFGQRTKANFTYRGTQYSNISVTDPEYYSKPDSWHTEKAILVISLPESPYNGKYYNKFIAKVFPI